MRTRAAVVAIALCACKSHAQAPSDAGDAAGALDAATDASSPSSDASDAPSPDDAAAPADDGGDVPVGGAGARAPKPWPPLASGAAWTVVRWDMTRAQAEEALARAGLAARPVDDRKTGGERLAIDNGPSHVVVYFHASKPSQIVVTSDGLTKDAAAAALARVRDRAGAPTKTTERTEHRWRRAGAGSASLVAASDGASWSLREEHVREGGHGATGFAQLAWGMAPAAALSALQAAGYTGRIVNASAAGLDPCSLPNAPPGCAKKAASPQVVFSKGDQEGTASFGPDGLAQIAVSGPVADRARAAAREQEIEGVLGKPSHVDTSTQTSQSDATTIIDVERRERQPEGALAVLETYRPKK